MKRKTRKRKTDKDGYEHEFDRLDIRDFKKADYDPLPSPEVIARSLRNAKITILLDQPTVDYFKREAQKHGAGYQQMIRENTHRHTH